MTRLRHAFPAERPAVSASAPRPLSTPACSAFGENVAAFSTRARGPDPGPHPADRRRRNPSAVPDLPRRTSALLDCLRRIPPACDPRPGLSKQAAPAPTRHRSSGSDPHRQHGYPCQSAADSGGTGRSALEQELPAQGIARTRAVLCPTLACCQSEAARHHTLGLYGAACS
jgi:hypothetical protein